MSLESLACVSGMRVDNCDVNVDMSMGAVVFDVNPAQSISIGIWVWSLCQGSAPICFTHFLCQPFSDPMVASHRSATQVAQALMRAIVWHHGPALPALHPQVTTLRGPGWGHAGTRSRHQRPLA